MRHVLSIRFVLLGLLLCAAGDADKVASTRPADGQTPAQAAFLRFKALDGRWAGKSTRGWDDRSTWKTIAAGSAVMHTSFDAHPRQTMLTVIHMDGPHLMLTHYCVARNQPRMRAGEISPDGRRVTFTFLDGTSLPSRDAGHMDRAVFQFHDDGTYTTQWTWYERGQERWMEEVRCTRDDAASVP